MSSEIEKIVAEMRERLHKKAFYQDVADPQLAGWINRLAALSTPPSSATPGDGERLPCPDCGGLYAGGEDGADCAGCDGEGKISKPQERAGSEAGAVAYRWLDDLRDRMDHCVLAADEGEDYAVSREMLDAMTTLGLMEKVGRGKWAPTEAGRDFAEAKPTLPIEIHGKLYEVPIRVQLHIVNLREKLLATRPQPPTP